MSLISNSYSKLIGCQIHNSIRVSPMALKIIDTKEFQRMRYIKQLALCHFVYPAATHTRFEHSIGVYYLSGKVLDKILQEYPDREYNLPDLDSVPMKLNSKIMECIKIGGLCHDIGHGPFSHILDDVLLKDSEHPNRYHEVRSCLIVEILCKRELSFELDDKHINFIKSIINPQKHHTGALYQIVSNYLNGIDVDKFDYLARDTKSLGLTTSFNFNRLINEFIIDQNGNIAYPKHSSSDIYEMFHSRYMMHKKVYAHKTVKLIELMLHDLFVNVDPIFGISKSIENMETFCELTDDTIFNYIKIIMESSLPFLRIKLDPDQYKCISEAHIIYQNIVSRNIYQWVLEISDENYTEIYLYKILNHILSVHPEFNKKDFEVAQIKIGFVSGNVADPFDSIFFYNKKEDDKTFVVKKNNISSLMSNKIQEVRWYLVCKNRSIYDTVMQEIKNLT